MTETNNNDIDLILADKDRIVERLRDDNDYYGEFGQQFLSNSNIGTLIKNPFALRDPQEPNTNFLIGGYFHTLVLEPHKASNYKIIEASSRNTKIYKEESKGDMCLLRKEATMTEDLVNKLKSNDMVNDYITGSNVEYEVPSIGAIQNTLFKGKADIINHDLKLIVDLKTTSDLDGFKYNSRKYNYDSQAFIYRELFGYEMVFIAIDKKTGCVGFFDVSDEAYERGAEKVSEALYNYELFFEGGSQLTREQYFSSDTI
jgi:hypothetical protein